MSTRARASSAAVLGLALTLGAWLGRPSLLGAQQSESERRVTAVARARGYGANRVGEVLLNGQVVFRIREPAGGLTPAERAEHVARRLNELASEGDLDARDLAVRQRNGVTGVYAGNELIVTADQRHATANRTTPVRLARQWRDNLSVGLTGRVASYRQEDLRATDPEADLATKLVPILTVGSAGSIGLAQVSGPDEQVDQVRAVAQISTDYRDDIRIRVLVPIHTENLVSNLRRVPRVAVTGAAGIQF